MYNPMDTLNDDQGLTSFYEDNRRKESDERDAVQKKTFTKWMNQHLIKAKCQVIDLFQDLRDGNRLITLLEVLSQEHLQREKGRMRFHKLQNINIALNFLNAKQVMPMPFNITYV